MQIKRGDTRPALSITCTDDGAAVDLTTATAVKVIAARAVGEAVVFNRSVSGGADGVVTMPWVAGDTDTVGRLLVEVEVTWPDATVQTFPPFSHLAVDIVEDLA